LNTVSIISLDQAEQSQCGWYYTLMNTMNVRFIVISYLPSGATVVVHYVLV